MKKIIGFIGLVSLIMILTFSNKLVHSQVFTGIRDQTMNSVKAKTRRTTDTTSSSDSTATDSSTTAAGLKTSVSESSTESETSDKPQKDSPEAIDWHNPSETLPYPTLEAGDWLDVALADQRVYIKRGAETLYTMYCSTGAATSPTPTGTYYIQAERGESFYNEKSGEGANYWVSWKNHGEYLFHSVPVDKNGQYIESEAAQLGKVSNSHGCIRLSIADAKWLYETVQQGMKVVIH